jgi:RNA polymerase sigma factor (TIGR02999 family)
MRQILVDWARREKARKRGGPSRTRVPLAAAEGEDVLPPVDVLDLHDALERLRDGQPRVADVVDLRFFGGAEMTEIATILAVSRRTVTADWEFARCWLRRELRESEADGD